MTLAPCLAPRDEATACTNSAELASSVAVVPPTRVPVLSPVRSAATAGPAPALAATPAELMATRARVKLPRITRDLHTTSAAVGLTLTGALVGFALGQLLVGPISDTFGRRRPMLIGAGLRGCLKPCRPRVACAAVSAPASRPMAACSGTGPSSAWRWWRG